MPYGIRTRAPDGTITMDITADFTSVIGIITLTGNSGSATLPLVPDWWSLLAGFLCNDISMVTVSGTSVTWNFGSQTLYPVNVVTSQLIYGTNR